jgi:hypothetical protein
MIEQITETEIKEKFRLSWEKSLAKYEQVCAKQDADFKFALKYGYFAQFYIEQIKADPETWNLPIEYDLEVLRNRKSYYRKKFNFCEKLYCGWLHTYELFLAWRQIIFRYDYTCKSCHLSPDDGSVAAIFFNHIQCDYIGRVEISWWRTERHKL